MSHQDDDMMTLVEAVEAVRAVKDSFMGIARDQAQHERYCDAQRVLLAHAEAALEVREDEPEAVRTLRRYCAARWDAVAADVGETAVLQRNRDVCGHLDTISAQLADARRELRESTDDLGQLIITQAAPRDVQQAWLEEFEAWYQPKLWLGSHRAAGAFLVTKITELKARAERAEAAIAKVRVIDVFEDDRDGGTQKVLDSMRPYITGDEWVRVDDLRTALSEPDLFSLPVHSADG